MEKIIPAIFHNFLYDTQKARPSNIAGKKATAKLLKSWESPFDKLMVSSVIATFKIEISTVSGSVFIGSIKLTYMHPI